jgi:SNF2 family DNA or RNA helicase
VEVSLIWPSAPPQHWIGAAKRLVVVGHFGICVMNGQWISCKKRGRDDERIERDKQIAKDLRLRRKGLQPPKSQQKKPVATATASTSTSTSTTNNNNKTKSRAAKTKKKKNSPLEGFVVDDDEEDELGEDSSDEESIRSVEKTKKKTAMSSDSSEVSSPDFLMGSKAGQRKWTSRPSNGLIARSKNLHIAKKRRPEVVTLLDSGSSSEDEELVITPPPSKPRNDDKVERTTVNGTVVLALDQKNSSDDDDSEMLDRNRPVKPPHFAKKSSNHKESSSSPSDNDDRPFNNGSSKQHFAKRTTTTKDPSSLLLQDSPIAPARGGFTSKSLVVKPSSAPLFDSTDDEVDEHHHGRPPTTSNKLGRLTKMKPKREKKEKKTKKKAALLLKTEDYDCSDEDEAMAIAAAMKASRNDMMAATGKTEAEDHVIDLLQDDSSAGEEDYHGGRVDTEARAAMSVLETANKLSALILQTMAKWSNSAVEGMIVDGAIALGAGAQGRDHTWISAETLKDIVPPDIKLAEYQLIGVNWMALLHGMKCEVEGNRTYANVNGILADEMGLGTQNNVLGSTAIVDGTTSHVTLFLQVKLVRQSLS